MRISDWSSDVCSSDLVHLLGNCGFKEQQEEAAKRHGCHTGERAGSGIGEARIEQINACKTEDRRKQRIEWHSEGPLRAGIAPAENEQGNSDKKEKEDRKSTRQDYSHECASRMPSSA